MITISAFADEIGPDLDLQMDICEANGVKNIDVRGIDDINVSSMTLDQVAAYRKRLDARGFAVPCIGSPLGKIKIDDDFDAHVELLRHTCDVAKGFGTDRIRVFSFYPAEGGDILAERDAVMERLARMVEVAAAAGCVLFHENESDIYGEKPDGIKDIFATIQSPALKGIFDPANFVTAGLRPYDEAWAAGLAELTDYFHIKDRMGGEAVCVPASDGDGQFDEIFADLKARGFAGYMTLEPHLASAGQFKGHTGPERFSKAVDGLKACCDRAGLAYA